MRSYRLSRRCTVAREAGRGLRSAVVSGGRRTDEVSISTTSAEGVAWYLFLEFESPSVKRKESEDSAPNGRRILALITQDKMA